MKRRVCVAMTMLAVALAPAHGAPRSKAHRAVPMTSPGAWLTDGDYPVAAAVRNQSGVAAFRLDIDVEGFVSGCTITSSSGVPLLDQATCAIIPLRARFLPATNDAGQKVTDSFTSRLTWRLPGNENATDAEAEQIAAMEQLTKEMEEARRKIESFASEISYTVEVDGHVSDCEQRFEGAVAARFTPYRCKDVPKVAMPFINEAGNTVPKRMTIKFAIDLADVAADGATDAPAKPAAP